ncbi:MAG: hypothetical protein C0399_12515 [Syntrophus sp. (in: bacteria)]|nr:hypothetical protein [Syntrophus sp. (in: bacteria)]
MIRRIVLCFIIIFAAHSVCFAGDPDSGYGTLIAVEFKVDNKSYKPPIIGHLEYTGFSIDIVSIFEGIAGIGILTQAQVYLVVEKKIVSKGVHQIKGKNQYGTTASGTIDFRDQVKPKITLVTEGGVVITNISNEGKEWQRKNIPNMSLGQ